ncbi:tetratricopeptide repeat protein [Butyrivibrio sp.]|uniref:tetratricopeptide repeat protein n=1 Tax=Butyrivibrio sp. TaxID=28121 RepID=UPI0025BEF9D5|nr:tetratricopeptide repeat protein [Butyrivibrio sp.]MBQ9305156.1 tetratricopeptide repeat protein [Butyrivibrio sp.]
MKKTPIKYLAILIVSVAVVVISVSALTRVFVNKGFVVSYEQGIYETSREKALFLMNFPQSYIPYYNVGNAAYQEGDYISAVSYYNDALKFNPKEPWDCQIRINLALALLHLIDFDNLDSEEKIQNALSVLYQARGVLVKHGCAEDKGENGHNKDAQQLKDDIDKMIEKLQKNSQDDNNSDQDNQESKDDEEKDQSGGSSDSNKQKQQQQALEQNKKNAMQERQEEIDQLEEHNKYSGQNSGSGESDGEQEENGEGGGTSEDGDGNGTSSGPKHPW